MRHYDLRKDKQVNKSAHINSHDPVGNQQQYSVYRYNDIVCVAAPPRR